MTFVEDKRLPADKNQVGMTDHQLDAVKNVLTHFVDPSSNLDLQTAGCWQIVSFKEGRLSCIVEINPAFKLQYEQLCRDIEMAIKKLAFIQDMVIVMTTAKAVTVKDSGKAELSSHKPGAMNQKLHFPHIKKIIAVASGKGGVGKSTVAVNIAVGLQQAGYKVGLMDADFYGPSVPKMLGLTQKPETTSDKKFVPLDFQGLKCMSIGFLVDTQTPIIWRGPIVQSSFQKLLTDTLWQNLDVLVIDLPPGTGDIHLTLVQKIELDGVIIVSTPQDLALIDARRAITMFQKLDTPILGMIENMSTFICPHCHQTSAIFDQHGAFNESVNSDIPYLGELPLHMDIRRGGDNGKPIPFCANDSLTATLNVITAKIIDALSIKV